MYNMGEDVKTVSFPDAVDRDSVPGGAHEEADSVRQDIHFPSRMMTLSGGLMTLSGLLMAVCGRLAIGGIFWAAASCLFFAAYHFRMAENKTEKTEDSDDAQETV